MKRTNLERIAAIASLYSLTIEEVEAMVADARRYSDSRSEAISSVEGRYRAPCEWGDFYTDGDRIQDIAVKLGVCRADVRDAVHDAQVHLGLSRQEALDAVEAVDVQPAASRAAAN